jgi:uncharacterized protein
VRAAAAVLLLVAATKLPAFTAPVVDQAGVVPAATEQQLDASLNAYQASSGHQIAVAVVKTTGSQSLEDYSIDLARKWGVGQKGKDNGVLLLIAYDDHRARIEVGSGVEGQLTDLQAGRIINEQIVPRMRAGDVSGALVSATDEIRRALGDTTVGAPAPPPATPTEQPAPGGFSVLAFLLPVLFALFAFGLVGGRRRRRGFFGFPIFWGGGWGGGGWGGGGFGGGGGGFGGGGGGGFSGGGASGGW